MNSPQQLISSIPAYVLQVMTVLEANGHQAWLVGGCVRDLLQAARPQDYDVATEARPDRIAELFAHHIMTGYRHGTVTVLIDHQPVEVTTFRSESEYSDGRRPDQVVFHSDIITDLLRRDFTINSMAWHPERGLLDPAQGQHDLQQHVLRCVGDPDQRFSEDGLRLLRALRFCAALDLTVSEETVMAATRQAWRIDQLSHERIWGELRKSMSARYPSRISQFAGTGMLEHAVCRLLGSPDTRQPLTEQVAAVSGPGRTDAELIALILLLTQSPPDQTAVNSVESLRVWADLRILSDWRKRLVSESRLAGHITDDALLILYWLGLMVTASVRENAANQDVRNLSAGLLRLLHARGRGRSRQALRTLIQMAAGIAEQLYPALHVEQRSTAAEALIDQIPLDVSDLPVSGNDLLAAGYQQGAELRMILERMLSYVLCQPGPVSKAELMDFAGKIKPGR